MKLTKSKLKEMILEEIQKLNEFMEKRKDDPKLKKEISKQLNTVERYMAGKGIKSNRKFNAKGPGFEMKAFDSNPYRFKVTGETDSDGNIHYELKVEKGTKYIHDPRLFSLKNAKDVIKNLKKYEK